MHCSTNLGSTRIEISGQAPCLEGMHAGWSSILQGGLNGCVFVHMSLENARRLSAAIGGLESMPAGDGLGVNDYERLRSLAHTYAQALSARLSAGVSGGVRAAAGSFYLVKEPRRITEILKSSAVATVLVDVQVGLFVLRVSVSVPFAVARPGERPTRKISQASDRTVLIVQKSDQLREFLKHALSLARYRVLEADGAVQAELILRQERVDIILADAALPETDGFAFSRWVKTEPGLKSIPVVLCANEVTRGMIVAAFLAGVRACVTKPLSRDAIVRKVEEALA